MRTNNNVVLSYFAVVLVLAMGAVGSASAENLLVNPGFEDGTMAGWEIFGVSANSGVTAVSGDNGPALPGTFNALMDNRAEAMGLTLKQSTAVGTAIGGQVMYSCDLKLDEAEVGGVLFVQIFAEADGSGIVGGSGLLGPFWAWEWTTVAGSFEAPANTTHLTIQVMANTGAAVGSSCVAHVDNVILDQGTVAAEPAQWSDIKALYR